MLKKSKIIAVLSVCVMMFAVVQPACAFWGEDTLYGGAVGGATGGFWGAVIGAVAAGAAVVATGGLAAIPIAAGAIGGAALTGAAVGGAGGAAVGAGVGAVAGKDAVNTTAVVASGVAGVATVGVGALPFVGAAVTGTATVGGGIEAVKSLGQSAVNHAVDEFKKNPGKATMGLIGKGYTGYEGAQLLSSFVKSASKENDSNMIKLDEKLTKLSEEGKKVELKKVEMPSTKTMTAYYTVDGVEHVETFTSK